MNRRIALDEALALGGFFVSWLFVLALALSPLR